MNYEKIYENLIENAKRLERKRDDGKYYESHHIIPRCCGGNDSAENRVLLTGREHFVAHALLVKANPKNSSLVFALNCMLRSTQHQSRNLNSRQIEFAKRKYAELMSIRSSKYLGERNPNFGNKWSDSQKKSLSLKKKGMLSGDKNPSKRMDVREKLSKGKLGSKNPMAKMWIIQSLRTHEVIELKGGLKQFLSNYPGSTYFKVLSGTDSNWKLLNDPSPSRRHYEKKNSK